MPDAGWLMAAGVLVDGIAGGFTLRVIAWFDPNDSLPL